MVKTKDLFLNIAANPNMTLEDLASVGLTSENTMLLDRAQYASNEKVQDMFRDSEGNFDEQKFNAFYDIAEQSYNILANDEANLNLMNVTAYDSDNIFVDPSKRRQQNAPVAVKLPNPDRLNVGINRIGKIGPRTLSQDEIAQTQKVLLNPTDVAKGAKPIYGSAPNDSWFEDFWDTRVMAAWDEDGTHIDPITGNETEHKKGDLKLNENGTYYYESLDGRSIYGKRILNKFNTLTTDGSSWNKYDFFDSDSIEQKSIGGSMLKNLALVGSMFIPYVGWGVAAASVAHQMAGLTATFGKMIAGSDSPTLDAIEGWVKSTDRRNLKTEYAQQNTWCWENFIDLIGDTTAQLREQRAIFKFAPGIIKGDFKALSDKAMKEYGEKIAQESYNNATKLSFRELVNLAYKQNPEVADKQLRNLFAGAKNIYSVKAEKAVRKYLDDYYKLGEPIAKAYMTAITVQDTFGEAIEAGATNSEATLLTLGYAAAEAALLSTDLGKWIMPELRTERLRNKMIAKKLLELPQETREMSRQISRLDGESKKAWAKRLFNVGKDIANAEYSMMPKTISSVLASGLGEGVEEVSEEALADFSKSCFNLVQQLQGDDVRLNAWNHNWNWSEAANRYGMSFAGGIIGGSINAAASDYKANREILNMNSQQAMQQLVYMARNNELDDFWKVINKTTLASTELSTKLNDNGIGYKPGTKDDNQDLAAKKALRKQIDLINSILNAENAKLDDNGLLSTLIKADPSLRDMDPVKEYRMRALSNSATAGRFLNEWNTINSDIIKNRMEQSKITSKYGDNSSQMSEEDNQQLKQLGQDLKALQERKDQMLDGTRTREYVRDALFEMTHGVNEFLNEYVTEVRYAEAKTGKKYKDLSDTEKQDLKEKYQAFKSSNQNAEQIHELADIYETMAITASQGLQASADYYEQVRQNNYQNIIQLNNLVSKRLSILNKKAKDSDQGINLIQAILDNEYQDDLVVFSDSQALLNEIQNTEAATENDINLYLNGRSEQDLVQADWDYINQANRKKENAIKMAIAKSVFDKVEATYDEFLKAGFIHPETKNMLSNMLTSLSKYNALAADIEAEIDYDLYDFYNERALSLSKKAKEINKLSNTPLIENLRQFQLSTDTDKTAVDLIEYLINKENSEKKDISSFQLDKATLQQFKDAKNLLQMYRAAIVGARYDNVDLDNIVGFNTTLNEISGANETPKLAEIDAQTADLALEDINKALKRLDYAESLHKLNTGNKYNVQDKTALNKQFIIYNKLKTFISILEGDQYDDWKQSESWRELNEAISTSSTLSTNSGFGGNYDARNFTLNPEQKAAIEAESIKIQEKLHKFLNENIDGSDASIDKLAKLLTYKNFKGLIRENNEFLEQTSEDIDDSAFIWWLCSTAALSADQFYQNYRTILGQEKEGEKPIAPIPTQELGVFALTAAITNGDMFRTFGKAIRKSLNTLWETSNETERETIANEAGVSYLRADKDKPYFKNNDFLPNFDNIVFVEGIAGSGKSTGVLKTLSRLLAATNPDLVSQKILFAHTNKNKAQTLGESTEFTNFEAHDHDSLLSYMSADYKPQVAKNGVYEYTMDKDLIMVDGIFRGKWEIASYNPDEVPKIIVIDEWSHYNQLEQDLIQRFAQQYGSTILTMGDYDQLTPQAKIFDKDRKEICDITPSRNMTPRIAKLGVSMRTDNEIKNGNMYRMLAWRQKPTSSPIDLHYYEDETGIYGDKQYQVSTSYGDQLEKIKLDIKKMISTLKDKEQIGYIYSDTNSELYKWLTSTEGIKEYIVPKMEKDAHGQEAQYYIVENNRREDQDALQYFNSVYTGITRSEQGSLLITNTGLVRNSGSNSKYNQTGINFTSIQDTEMLPNTFTDAGTREFTKKRKAILDGIYGNAGVIAFDVKPRTTEKVTLNPPQNNAGDPSLTSTTQQATQQQQQTTQQQSQQATQQQQNTQQQQQNTQQQTTQQQTLSTQQQPQQNPPLSNNADPGLPPLPNDFDYEAWVNNNDKPEPSLEEFGGTRIPDNVDPSELFAEPDENWIGPLPKNQKLYSPSGILVGTIVREVNQANHHGYYVRKVDGTEFNLWDKSIENHFFTKLPEYNPIFKIGDKFKFQNATIHTITNVKLYEDKSNITWLYETDKADLTHEELEDYLRKGTITPYEEVENIPPTTAYETEGQQEYEEAINEQYRDIQPESVSEKGKDIDFKLLGFTFNNQYLADEFDDDDNIILTNDDRIDNGYGLYKMNPTNFKSKTNIKAAIGSIRQHLEYSSNADICSHISQITGKQNLKIRWAFISKSGETEQNGKYNRYNAPSAFLEYMGKEDTQVPLKTISAIIYDKGKPVLELPIITFQSPHSILRQMEKQQIGMDVVQLWKQKTTPEDTYPVLTKILNYIRNNKQGLPGYQHLGDVIKMWLFTSNGFKLIPNDPKTNKSWNLHEYSTNLGNLYITEKLADDVPEFNFSGTWVDLTTVERQDRFISSILMNKDDFYDDPISKKSISIFRKYVPYVLISDSPKIKNDEQAAKQYLRQQADPTVEKIVKAIPVSPPQVSVSTYIQAMDKILKGDKNQPYGNEYTPYRIWQAILSSNKKDMIMQHLDISVKQFVEQTVAALDALANQVPIDPNGSKLDYKKAVAKKLNEYEKDNMVFAKLRKALVKTCIYNAIGIDSNTNPISDPNVLNAIQQVCDATNKITGVLCKPHFANDQKVGIAGFAYKVNTQGKFQFPGQGSFRIFGKIDPPTYNLNIILDYMSEWAKDATKGITVIEQSTGSKIEYPNIWRFKDKWDENYYLSNSTQSNISLENILPYCQELLARLGMDQYNIDTSVLLACKSEGAARRAAERMINQEYIKTPGAFVLNINGEFKYGNINTQQTPEWKDYFFEQYFFDRGKHYLRFTNNNTTEDIEIGLDLANNKFIIASKQSSQTMNSDVVKDVVKDLNELMNGEILKNNAQFQGIMKEILNQFNANDGTANLVEIQNILNNSGLDPYTITSIEVTLKLDELNQEQKLDCIIPLKISFK